MNGVRENSLALRSVPGRRLKFDNAIRRVTTKVSRKMINTALSQSHSHITWEQLSGFTCSDRDLSNVMALDSDSNGVRDLEQGVTLVCLEWTRRGACGNSDHGTPAKVALGIALG